MKRKRIVIRISDISTSRCGTPSKFVMTATPINPLVEATPEFIIESDLNNRFYSHVPSLYGIVKDFYRVIDIESDCAVSVCLGVPAAAVMYAGRTAHVLTYHDGYKSHVWESINEYLKQFNPAVVCEFETTYTE